MLVKKLEKRRLHRSKSGAVWDAGQYSRSTRKSLGRGGQPQAGRNAIVHEREILKLKPNNHFLHYVSSD